MGISDRLIFQPTPPARTETRPLHRYLLSNPISTHSAREDGDVLMDLYTVLNTKFQPTPPARTETMPRRTSQRSITDFNPLRPRGRRQQYYTKKPTILHHISTIKSHHTPSNHRQPTLHTSKTVLIVQFFRCESPRKFMFASGSHQTI